MADIKLLPCPFCGTDLAEFPTVMTIHKATSEKYVKYLREVEKVFAGSDDYYVVQCIHCGSMGEKEITKEKAAEAWNKRKERDKQCLHLQEE